MVFSTGEIRLRREVRLIGEAALSEMHGLEFGLYL